MTWLRVLAGLGLSAALLLADPRTNAPTIQEASPVAVTRGIPNELKITGINLRGASAILFDDQSLTGEVLHVNELGKFNGRNGVRPSIDIGDPPPLNEVTVEISVADDAEIGLQRFRLVTPEGTTNAFTVSVEPYFGARPEIEPNDDLPDVALQEDYLYLPVIATGTIRRPGDVDHLPIRARGGEELVFHVGASELGSKLRWKLELLDEKGSRLAGRSILDDLKEPVLAYRVPRDGRYYAVLSDLDWGGSADHFYRLKIGSYPYVTSAFPLGVKTGEAAEVRLRGYNLGENRTVEITGAADDAAMARLDFRPEVEGARAHNRLRLAVGDFPSALEQDRGADFSAATQIAMPSSVDGRVSGFADGGARADEDYYRFAAKKGQRYFLEVEARRLGSPLDSVLEVLDSKGEPVPQVMMRAVVATKQVLSDRDSGRTAIRLDNLKGFAVGDYALVGNEVLKVEQLPNGPDEDTFFEAFGGQRLGFFNTTPEAHAVDTPIYKVTAHDPGTPLPSNGLPVVTLPYRNDDGGPGYGKDSLLDFTAPADGDYVVWLRDLRGFQGEDFAYRLTVREARPQFRLTAAPENPNVPRGGRVAVKVTASRLDGFEGPIAIAARDLPAGVSASSETIAASENSTVIVLSAAADAALARPVALRIRGLAEINGQAVERWSDPDDHLTYLAVAEPPDLYVDVTQEAVTLEAGGTTTVMVNVRRAKGFAGRVPVSVLNLPYGVRVIDVGLNGVLITEEQTSREFTLEALPWVKPGERKITLTGRVETRARANGEYAAEPLALKIVAGPVSRLVGGASGSAASAR